MLLAVRTPPTIVRRDIVGFPSQLLGIAGGSPRADGRLGRRTLRRVTLPDLTAHGLPAPRRPYSDFLRRRAIPILDVGLVDRVQARRVHVVAALERFEGRGPARGRQRVDVDAVVAATGFRTGLEPLVGHLGILDHRDEPVIHGARTSASPGLHFVGYRLTLGGAFRVIGSEAKESRAGR